MPTVAIERDILFDAVHHTYTDKEFDELCFEFGIELDEITSDRIEAEKSSTKELSKKELAEYSDTVIYKIDVPANRYDLLCVEGLARALRIFLGDIATPQFALTDDKQHQDDSVVTMNVDKPHCGTIRPYVVCAILRDITFNKPRYASFIDLQDQLHRNLCRQRTLVAIGTHDLDTVSGPFTYDAQPPSAISFVPLTPDDKGPIQADELMTHYETDPACKHLKPYVGIIKSSPLYPVIRDANGVVLSLPPLINGSHSKITLDTKNVLIECTATDLTKANIVLDTMVTMFSEYCATSYTIEPVVVNYRDADDKVVQSYTTPCLSKREEKTTIAFCNSLIGIDITAQQMRELCNKVQLGPATLLDNDTVLQVHVPPTRSDILHQVDIAEDIGIAYGYNNIVKRIPTTCTVGAECNLNQMTDLLRDEIARAGYIECLTHGLCSIQDNFVNLQRQPTPAVSLSNPANVEYQVVRTTLLPGLLKTLQHNRSASFAGGFKLFEISDVVLVDPDATAIEPDTRVGTRNERHVAAIYAGPTSGFETIHGLVDRIMTLTEIGPATSYNVTGDTQEEKYRITRAGWTYTIEPIVTVAADTKDEPDATYFPNRAASIVLTKPDPDAAGAAGKAITKTIGTFGILHPRVLSNFRIEYPASCVELNLEELM